MILCITEKPAVGADIARLLGANNRHDGFFEGNNYCVTWTFGHLCSLKDPADYYEGWKHWSLSALPMIPQRFGIKVIDQPRIIRQMNVIESLIPKAEKIINCGDAGQEGELIQRWVMQKAKCSVPVERLWTSSLTDEALLEGFNHLRPSKDLDSLYIAGLCRAIGDWVLGINATRLYTLKYAKDRQVLSVGRVQTPTLALIVSRQAEIENFVPKDSWELRTIYRDTTFIANIDQFKAEQEAVPVLDRLKQFPLVITEVSKKKGKEGAPKLFDLTGLQIEANKKFGLSASETLSTIQSLYEKKLTTYPRVDTTYLTEDIYRKCGPTLNGLSQYKHLTDPLRGKPLRKSKKVFDNSKVTDHHAIIPTGQPLPQGLSSDELRIFDLIAKRFIAVFYPDCEFQQTSVSASVDDTPFKASGRVILNPGWKQVFASDKASSQSLDAKEANQQSDERDPDAALPPFRKGESGPHSPFLAKKTTKPPQYYTQGTLLKAMDTAGDTVDDEDLREALKANGIGRPSTRNAIIDILLKRGYIIQERKSLRATQAGIDLINIIHEDLLKSAKLTGIWERKLREIEAGQYSAEKFMDQLKKMIHAITLAVIRDNSNRTIQTQPQQETKTTKKFKK